MAKTILVADDAAFMRMLLRDILSGEGYEVCEAVNGRDACEKFAEVRPDVVTLDVAMPEMDGIAAARTILARDPEARVIMVSAQRMPQVREDAISAGVFDFIQKPFPPERILASVRGCLSGAARHGVGPRPLHPAMGLKDVVESAENAVVRLPFFATASESDHLAI